MLPMDAWICPSIPVVRAYHLPMAAITQRGQRGQIRVKHRLLPKPFFDTFATEAEARAYAQQFESMLDRGIVPMELLDQEKRGSDPLLSRVLEAYMDSGAAAPTDMPTMALLREKVGAHRLSAVSASWADNWVADMKTGERPLAPGTIRKRVGALARAIDAHWRANLKGAPPGNPLRYMPRGYSQYDASAPGARADESRDRRMLPGELLAVRRAMSGERNPSSERSIVADPAFSLLFELILNTGLRLSEAYGLKVSQVDVASWVLRVDGSKGERGKRKPRVVPLVPSLRAPLRDWCADRVGLVFPFWTGLPEDKRNATNRLSARFATLFGYAGVPDFTEHDLRHEATCRWIEMRGGDGRWVFSETEVCRIMGWSDTKMMLRYASLRGEDLSARLG